MTVTQLNGPRADGRLDAGSITILLKDDAEVVFPLREQEFGPAIFAALMDALAP